jgi:hypothetical protein
MKDMKLLKQAAYDVEVLGTSILQFDDIFATCDYMRDHGGFRLYVVNLCYNT